MEAGWGGAKGGGGPPPSWRKNGRRSALVAAVNLDCNIYRTRFPRSRRWDLGPSSDAPRPFCSIWATDPGDAELILIRQDAPGR